jgi:REP element-mobilizing transposase RayT
MTYDPQRHHRRSIRLKGYDYTQPGAYFITICTHGRECLFGEIIDGEMHLNEAGQIVVQTWQDLPNHVPNVQLDAFVVMPNHVHGIIIITDRAGVVGTGSEAVRTTMGSGSAAGSVGAGSVGAGSVGAGSEPAPTTTTAPGSAAGSGPTTGPGSTMGSGPTTGPGSTMGSGPTTGPGSTMGSGPTTGPGSTMGSGPTTGPGSTMGSGPTTGPGSTTGSGPTTGPGSTMGSGPTTGPGSTMGSGPTTGPGSTMGSGPTAGPGPTTGSDPVGAGSEPAPTEPAPTEPAPTEPAPTEPAPTEPAPTRSSHGLPEIVRQFKTFSARRINELRGTPGTPVWQRNYYEHIIRDESSLNRIRQYIAENPVRWDADRENPQRPHHAQRHSLPPPAFQRENPTPQHPKDTPRS